MSDTCDYREETLEEIASHGEENLLDYIEFLEDQLRKKDDLIEWIVENPESLTFELDVLANQGMPQDEVLEKILGPLKSWKALVEESSDD